MKLVFELLGDEGFEFQFTVQRDESLLVLLDFQGELLFQDAVFLLLLLQGGLK